MVIDPLKVMLPLCVASMHSLQSPEAPHMHTKPIITYFTVGQLFCLACKLLCSLCDPFYCLQQSQQCAQCKDDIVFYRIWCMDKNGVRDQMFSLEQQSRPLVQVCIKAVSSQNTLLPGLQQIHAKLNRLVSHFSFLCAGLFTDMTSCVVILPVVQVKGFRGWVGLGHFCPVLGTVPWAGWSGAGPQCDGDGFTAGILLSLTKTIFRSTPLACYLVTRIYVRCQECIGLADPLAIQDTHSQLIGNDVKQGYYEFYLCSCVYV